MINIQQICQDLYEGTNYPGVWGGSTEWGKSADFHEHPFLISEMINNFLPNRKLNIIETGRCVGQSTNLLSAIAQNSGGYLYSFDPLDWNREHIIKINEKYGVSSDYYKYIVDLSFNADQYLPEDFKVDVLFLDSLHTYDCVKQETLLLEKRLQNKSIIFFHDTVWCFDAVMGWIKDYLGDKKVIYVKHQDTHKPQCFHCENNWGMKGKMHGRPHMIHGRPDFQADVEVNTSPYYNNLNYNFINWEDKDFETALLEDQLVFTNIEACCGMGVLFINK